MVPVAAAALENEAKARYLDLDYPAALATWERAYAAYRTEHDNAGAVRIARTLAGMYGQITGDAAVMRGWLARATTLLGSSAESAEHGWVSLNAGMFESDRGRRESLFGEAFDIGRRQGDADLEFTALAYLGASLVHDDRTAEGMALLDEALAAVAGDEVEDLCAIEEIFCQLFAACEHAHDVRRADSWIRVGDTVAERRRLPAVSGFCHTHYGAVLTAAGRWAEADAALTQAVAAWGLGQRSALRRGAIARLAELRVRQGRYEEAEQLLADVGPVAETAFAAASIQLATSETALAAETVERALAQMDAESTGAVPLLDLLVDVRLAEGDVPVASATADLLHSIAERHASSYVTACSAFARGRVHRHGGHADALNCLREAVAGFAAAEMPMELARTRFELAAALAETSPTVATDEARAALAVFERLRAARHVDATVALLRTLGVRIGTSVRSDGRLTNREAEVLDLLGHGLSNPEIAERLFISRKTVEHHVGNILGKLGLRSRAEAAAYATRTGK